MNAEDDVRRILSAYLRKNAQAQVTYSSFLGYIERYLQQNELENPNLAELRNDTHQVLSSILRRLEKSGAVQIVRTDSSPLTIIYPQFYTEEVEKAYQSMGTSMTVAFPSEDRMTIQIPDSLIHPIDVKTEFVSWLSGEGQPTEDDEEPAKERPVLRLLFPDGLPSILAVRESLGLPLVLGSVQKLRQYLHIPKNMTYIRQKLLPVFRGREIPLKDVLQQILTSPELCAKAILNADDFQFQFWTHLSTNVIKEFGDKHDKLLEEQNYCQAAYLLGYYSVYCKGIEQRKKDAQAGLKSFGQSLRKPPYAYTISDIYGLTDDKGVQLLQKYNKDQLHGYLADQMKSADGRALPAVMRVTLPNSKEYYVAYESVPLIIAQQLPRAQKAFRDFYLYTWQAAMLAGRSLKTIDSEQAFEEHVENRLQERFPLLFSMLRFDTIYLISQEASTRPELRGALLALLHMKEQKLKPYREILQLDHAKLLADVKILLPFWMVVPVVREIVGFLRKMFLGGSNLSAQKSSIDFEGQEESHSRASKSSRSAAKGDGNGAGSETTRKQIGTPEDSGAEKPSHAQSAKAQQAAYKEQVRAMASSLLDSGTTLDHAMKEYIDKWNPLIDQTAKKNLVEDVNSMCRDFLRGLKLSYRKPPPTIASIKEMSSRLSGHQTFERIRDREALRRYIELYFLKILSK